MAFTMQQFRDHFEMVRENHYSYNQTYFFFKKPNGEMYMITDASGQFGEVAIGDTERGDENGCGYGFGISKGISYQDKNGVYNPVDRLCEMVKDYTPFHVSRDERGLIDHPRLFSQVLPRLQWDYALTLPCLELEN